MAEVSIQLQDNDCDRDGAGHTTTHAGGSDDRVDTAVFNGENINALTLDIVLDAKKCEQHDDLRDVELAKGGPEAERRREDSSGYAAAERTGGDDELEDAKDE